MKILVSRWQMCGGGLAYEVCVPVDQAPIGKDKSGYQLIKTVGGKHLHFLTLYDALVPASHFALSPGIERWEEHKVYDKLAAALAFDIAQNVYPELERVSPERKGRLSLWFTGLLSPEPKGHSDVWIDVPIKPNAGIPSAWAWRGRIEATA